MFTPKQIVSKLINNTDLLWDYMTALRGPDDEDNEVKALFTCPLRGECPTYLMSAGDFLHHVSLPLSPLSNISHHFFHHILGGWRALRWAFIPHEIIQKDIRNVIRQLEIFERDVDLLMSIDVDGLNKYVELVKIFLNSAQNIEFSGKEKE